jgi:hypothetical protein
MTLAPSSKSFHAKLFKSTYGREKLPTNLCSYFWLDVLAFIIMIPAWPGHLINIIRKKNDTAAFIFVIHVFVALMIGLLFYTKEQQKNNNILIPAYFIGMACFVSFIGVIIGIIFLVGYLKELAEKRRYNEFYKIRVANPELDNYEIWERVEERHGKKGRRWLLTEWFKAFKGKYCPRLDWKE